MNKPTKKTATFDPATIKEVANVFSYSEDYIRKCIRGDRVGIMPDEVKKMYTKIMMAKHKASQRIIKEAIPNH